MLRFASSRFPTCARLVALRPAIRLSHTDVDRLSAGELRQKLDSTAQPADTITVDIKSKTEQSQSGYVHDSYNIKVSDLKETLAQTEGNPAHQPRFQYFSGRVTCYINSPGSSDMLAQVRRRGHKNPDAANKPVEEGFNGEYGAANKEASKGTSSGQPVNL